MLFDSHLDLNLSSFFQVVSTQLHQSGVRLTAHMDTKS